MEDTILKYIVEKIPIIGAFIFIAYFMIKNQMSQLSKEISDIEKKRKDCEFFCKAKIDSYNADLKHLELSMNKGFEEVKVSIAEIKTELKLLK